VGLGGGSSGGGGQTDWSTESGYKRAQNLKKCATSAECNADVCATQGELDKSGGQIFRCFPKIADGGSIRKSMLEAQSGIKNELCKTGATVDGDKCGKITACTNAASCADSSNMYCDKNSICQSRKRVNDACGPDLIKGDDPVRMCQKDLWCKNGKCTDQCENTGDCASKANTYCGEDSRTCIAKLAKGGICRATLVAGTDPGRANQMCRSGTCDTSTNPDKCT
jgi:hypothetical protein